jgi:hypothetical protein
MIFGFRGDGPLLGRKIDASNLYTVVSNITIDFKYSRYR